MIAIDQTFPAAKPLRDGAVHIWAPARRTGIAAGNTGRRFIGLEEEAELFQKCWDMHDRHPPDA
jgi:hypothetical protein